MTGTRRPFRAVLPLMLTALAVALAVPAGAAAGACRNAGLAASAENLDEVRAAVACLVDRERARRGRDELRRSERLRRAASRHSRDMVRRGYFSHVSPTGEDVVSRARRTGYVARSSGWRLAENIGWAGGSEATAGSLVAMWMDSPGHRRNILRADLEHVGVGLAAGTPRGGSGLTATLLFGSRG